jgi:Mn-dependent DtxR family transcriptional regulator
MINPNDYEVTVRNKMTGELITHEEYLEAMYRDIERKGKFEMTNKGLLATLLELIPHTGAQILAFLIRNKEPGNLIVKQNKEIAEELQIGINSVSRTMKIFVDSEMIRKKDRGVYMLNPNILSYGGGVYQRAIRKWRELS